MVLLNDANDGACDDIIFLPYQFVDSLFDPGVDEFDIDLSMENQLPWWGLFWYHTYLANCYSTAFSSSYQQNERPAHG